MTSILKLSFSIIKKNIKLFISMILISAIGIAIVVGLQGAYGSLKEDVDSYIAECEYPQIILDTTLSRTFRVDEDAIRSIEGVKNIGYRFVLDMGIVYNERSMSVRAFSYSNEDFPKYRILNSIEKTTETGLFNVSLEYEFATDNHIALGDTIELNFNGAVKQGYVYQYLTSPECFSPKQNKYIFTTTTDFGYLYLDKELLESMYLGDYFNQILILTENGLDYNEISDKVEATLPTNVVVKTSTTYDESIIKANISDNIDPLENLSYYLPVCFFIISLIINVLFLYQIVLNYKKEIGILLTIGYSKKQVYFIFILTTLFIVLLAAIIGFAVGYLIDYIVYIIYVDGHFRFIPKVPRINMIYYLLGVLISFVVCMSSVLFVTFSIVHFLTPIEAITTNTETKTIGIKLKMNPRIKIEVNRFLRNWKKNVTTILIIASTFALIFASLSFQNSIDVITSDLFEKRYQYEAIIYLNSKLSENDLRKFNQVEGASNAELLYYTVLEIENSNGDKENCLINGLKENTDKMQVLGMNHNIIEMPTSGIVLDYHTAKNLNVSVGDFVYIKEKEIKVAAISNQDVARTAYINQQELASITDLYITCVLCDCNNQNALLKYASSRSDYASMGFHDLMYHSAIQATSLARESSYVIVILSVLLGVFVIIAIKEISMEEESRTIAVKRTLGFKVMHISNEFMVEDIIKLIPSIALGIFIGRKLSQVALAAMESATRTYPYLDNLRSYLFAIIFTVGFMLISHFVIIERVKRLNLPELIKDKE